MLRRPSASCIFTDKLTNFFLKSVNWCIENLASTASSARAHTEGDCRSSYDDLCQGDGNVICDRRADGKSRSVRIKHQAASINKDELISSLARGLLAASVHTSSKLDAVSSLPVENCTLQTTQPRITSNRRIRQLEDYCQALHGVLHCRMQS